VHTPADASVGRKHVEAHRHAPDRRSVPPAACAIGNGPDRFPDILKHTLPQLHKTLGAGVYAHLPSNPQEQRLAQLIFEQENLTADRRLRDVQLPAARRERTGLAIVCSFAADADP